eukprot:Lithocolla_globosa_v1_NODE_2842_length_1851_cov_25.532294.p1 type:complete len:335 gc:universal NODE_2842_length_1851_cov_25.532294:1550-546(-)
MSLTGYSFITDTTLGELVKGKKHMIAVPETATIATCLKMLKEHKILSLPVYKKEHENNFVENFKKLLTLSTKEVFVGIVSVFEIMAYVTSFTYTEMDIKNKTVEELNEDAKKKMTSPISECLGITKETETLWSYKSTDTLQTITTPTALGVHRCLVNDENHSYILTQTDIISFLAKNIDEMPSNAKKTVAELGLFNKDKAPVTLNETQTALAGFIKMIQDNLNALPVVNDSGKLVDTLSVSDLRYIVTSSFLGEKDIDLSSLLKPVLEFLSDKPASLRDDFSCDSQDTLEFVLKKLAKNKIHRLWIQFDGKPTGTISMSDIIAKFAPGDLKKAQ